MSFLLSSFVSFGVAELYPQDNAASIITEVNSIGSWSNIDATITSDATTQSDGTWSLKVISTAINTNSRGFLNFTVVNGQAYEFKFWAKRGSQGTNQKFRTWSGFVSSPSVSIADTTWTEYTMNATANIDGTATLRAYTGAVGDDAVGNELFLDQISIIKT